MTPMCLEVTVAPTAGVGTGTDTGAGTGAGVVAFSVGRAEDPGPSRRP
jgi:hypothetical protein